MNNCDVVQFQDIKPRAGHHVMTDQNYAESQPKDRDRECKNNNKLKISTSTPGVEPLWRCFDKQYFLSN